MQVLDQGDDGQDLMDLLKETWRVETADGENGRVQVNPRDVRMDSMVCWTGATVGRWVFSIIDRIVIGLLFRLHACSGLQTPPFEKS